MGLVPSTVPDTKQQTRGQRHASPPSLVGQWQLRGRSILGPVQGRAKSPRSISTGLCCHGHLTTFSRDGQVQPRPPSEPSPIQDLT